MTEQEQKRAREYFREAYLRSEPSVDVDTATEIVPWEHKLKQSELDKLNEEFSDLDQVGRFQLMLNSGPSIIS